MIKFFRKIRQKLLSKNHISKYLLYAIGEILLVVIGILLALQINNWNDQRKAHDRAAEIYTNLLTSLEQDSAEVQTTIGLLSRSLEVQKNLIIQESALSKKEFNQMEMDQLVEEIVLGVMSFFPKTGVYDLITSNNSMDLLKSERIKSLLINLYDFQYKRYENVDHIIDDKYHHELNSLIREKIKFVGTFNSESEFTSLHQVDSTAFKRNYADLVSECRDIYGLLSTANNYLMQIRDSIQDLLTLIRRELKTG